MLMTQMRQSVHTARWWNTPAREVGKPSLQALACVQVRANGAEEELKQLHHAQRSNDATVAQLQKLLHAQGLHSLAELQAALQSHEHALRSKDNAVAEAHAKAEGHAQAQESAEDQLDVARSDLQEERRRAAALAQQVTELTVAKHTANTQARTVHQYHGCCAYMHVTSVLRCCRWTTPIDTQS